MKAKLLEIFAWHELLVNRNLRADDTKNTVKISAMITVCLPLIVVLIGFVAIFSEWSTEDSGKTVIFVTLLVIYFGVSSITDRIYERNRPAVQKRAQMISANARQGRSWARRRLAGIYAANFLAIVVIVSVVKLYK